jgi:hypothetical protein
MGMSDFWYTAMTGNDPQEEEANRLELEKQRFVLQNAQNEDARKQAADKAAQDAIGKFGQTLQNYNRSDAVSQTLAAQPKNEKGVSGMTLSPEDAQAIYRMEGNKKQYGEGKPDLMTIANMSGVSSSEDPAAKGLLGGIEKQVTLQQQEDLKNKSLDEQRRANEERLAQEKLLREEGYQTQRDIAQMGATSREHIAGESNATRSGGAMRGPGATVISRLNGTADFKQQNMKVSSAAHAMSLIDQMKNPDGSFNATSPQAAELAMNMANLVSGGNAHTVEEFKAMDQKSLAGSITNFYNRLTGSNLNTLPKNWADLYKETIGRQGAVAQSIRDGYVDPVVDAVTAGMNMTPETVDQIRNSAKHMGVDFISKYPEFDPDRQQKQATSSPLSGGSQTKIVNGVTYTKGTDGLWHKQ